jgi:subtilisin family serine protease
LHAFENATADLNAVSTNAITNPELFWSDVTQLLTCANTVQTAFSQDNRDKMRKAIDALGGSFRKLLVECAADLPEGTQTGDLRVQHAGAVGMPCISRSTLGRHDRLALQIAIASALMFCISTGSVWAGIASLDTRWDTRQPLRICFYGGTPEARSQIAEIAIEWTIETNISFDFGAAPSFTSCEPRKEFDIRISFDKPGFWTNLGAAARAIPQDRPTLNLGGLDRGVEKSSRMDVLHQFGHALGILHEEQDPKGACLDELNPDAIKASRWSAADLEYNTLVPNNGHFVSTGFDIASVMRLFTDPTFFKRGTSSPCYAPPSDELSVGDHYLAGLLYPERPPDVSAEGESRYLTIRFEGALAAEHFGMVIDALYAQRTIWVTKYVAVEDTTIAKVVADQRLAPKGILSQSFEDFLCRVNPHICTVKDGKTIWRNAAASRNYRDENINCGDLSLPRNVFCLPNIRLEAYDSLTSIPYKGGGGSLKQVVKKLGACEEWNDACRTLIRRLNRKYEDKFTTSDELLSKSFVGELLLPVRSYRLVIEYRNADERLAIQQVVLDVIDTRAKQLGVDRSKVAIEITDPIGNPRRQIAIYSQPVKGYIPPLQVMHYPYGDDATELFKYPHIAAAIWDTHVDDLHCELNGSGARVIFPTFSDIPADEPPPDRIDQCGLQRPEGVRYVERYDHGTAVAGVLAAQLSGNGISGLFPNMRIWAWEVLSGDQFNKDDDPRLIMYRQYELDPKVVNISQTFPEKTKGLKNSLQLVLFGGANREGIQKTALIVAAAGISEDNASGERVGRKIDSTSGSDCTFFPACWGNVEGNPRGMISVVALNSKGDDLLRDQHGDPMTNYGSAFDVGAVGEVTTTLHGNYTGMIGGSSFAAPYVTGLAALVFAKVKYKGLDAGVPEVKQRVLFTADKPRSLSGTSRFGRINFERALSFEDDILDYKPSPLCLKDHCRVQARVNRRLDEVIYVTFATRDQNEQINNLKISFPDIKYILAQGDGLFTVRYVDESGRLRALEDAKINSTGLSIISMGGNSFPLELDKINEFVSCSFFDYCRRP